MKHRSMKPGIPRGTWHWCLLLALCVLLPASVARAAALSPAFVQQAMLTQGQAGTDGGPQGVWFGGAMALSADGGTLLVGAGNKPIGGSIVPGVAYIFVRTGGTWTQQAELTAPKGVFDDHSFGGAVALSADGDTALVAAERTDVGRNPEQGAVYVFVRADATWVQQAELTADDGDVHDGFGRAVALSSDGVTALIGAPDASIGDNYKGGASYIFARSGEAWTRQAKLTADDGDVSDGFGSAVALSGDAGTAIVAAWDKGAAYLFTRTGTTWNKQTELMPRGGPRPLRFGDAVALSGDGHTVLVGSGYDRAAYAYTRSGATWGEPQVLQGKNAAAQPLVTGYAMALSGDGTIALVSHPDMSDHAKPGVAYLFVRAGGKWGEQAELRTSDGATDDDFGEAVALSGDGSTAAIGAPAKGEDTGATYVFAAPSDMAASVATPTAANW